MNSLSNPSAVAVATDCRPSRNTIWWVLTINALPGILAGVHLANLLFFLNPDLPFEFIPVFKTAALCGALLAILSCLVLAPWSHGHRGQARRILPWAITLVLGSTALLDWMYAARYSFFLPPGINARMLKAAVWLTLISLICFYTALLHTLHRRPYGSKSRFGLLFLALVSVYVVVERREAFKPRLGPPPRPSVVEMRQRPVLFVVGIDGASLDAVLPLARQGRLPFFTRLLETGVYARPKSFSPVQREALWTTLATGRVPYLHGIVSDRVYPVPLITEGAHLRLLPPRFGETLWRGVSPPRPIDATFRHAATIWEVLERLHVSSGLVGWPVTDPVSPTELFSFSYRYFEGEFSPSTAQPSELAERGILFRVEPEELDPALVADLGDHVPYYYLQALAGDLWRESLTRFLLEQRRAQAVFLMLPGLSQVSSESFGGFAAVQFSGVQRRPYLQAATLLTAYYRHLDQFLSTLWESAPGPRLLAVVSAYGFEAPEGWEKLFAQLTGRGLKGRSQLAPDGLLLLSGEGLKEAQLLENVELVDIVPTLLYALGLPIARDLDGQVLTEAFTSSFLARNPLTVVPSYATLEPQGEVEPPSSPMSF